jgi:phenylalanyl-tRNA synthetase alpha chain
LAERSGRGEVKPSLFRAVMKTDARALTQGARGKPQLLEPPGADPHAGWCGRGGEVTLPPMPIGIERRKIAVLVFRLGSVGSVPDIRVVGGLSCSLRMMNEEIPNLTAFDEAALDAAFGKVEQQARSASFDSPEAVEAFRLQWLGRKQGLLNEISNRWIKAAPPAAKKPVGERFKTLKELVEDLLEQATGSGPSDAALAAEAIDITLPGTRRLTGAEHPITKTLNEITSVFAALGYSVGVGPEVETDFYNFESMNFPPGHPARDTQDTLVVANQERRPLRDRLLLRTHTSPVQMRTMETQPPPVRIIIPGKVHRNDAADATHSPIFHQVEGLCVDTNITFSDLKGTLDHAMKALFGSAVKTRFFPSFFPFTEPSADVQISCIFCGGKGCRKCKNSGWIELLGCGMVDPAVFAFAAEKQPAYDPRKISGFAFGMGVERIAMMKYGISEIGQFYAGDMRFLGQFA